MLKETQTSIPLCLTMYAARISINTSKLNCPYLDHLFHHSLPIHLLPRVFALLPLKNWQFNFSQRLCQSILSAVSALLSPLLSTISEIV